MKKAGILTLHYGFNEGAILQAYALAKLIEQHLGIEAEIIDHRYPAKETIYGAPETGRETALSDAIENWLPLSAAKFQSTDHRPTFEHVSHQNKLMFVGSDQVWNLKYRRHLRRFLGRGVLPTQPYGFFPAFPNVYWPDANVSVPKVSYAAAIGRYEWTETPAHHRRKMERILNDFAQISVRDERSLRFLEWVGPAIADRASIVPDPTLATELLDHGRLDALRSLLAEHGVDLYRPRCGIVCDDHGELARFAVEMKNRGYQVIAITTANSYCDIELFDKPFHPLDWALLFGLMDVCVVERMHAAIYCLRNFTPFVLLDINETAHDNDSKSKSLMRRFSLDEYCVSKDKVKSGDLFERVMAVSKTDIHADRTAGMLRKMGNEAREFFKKLA